MTEEKFELAKEIQNTIAFYKFIKEELPDSFIRIIKKNTGGNDIMIPNSHTILYGKLLEHLNHKLLKDYLETEIENLNKKFSEL